MDGDAAQYSLPLCIALALLNGAILPEHLLPDHFDRPAVWDIVDKIRLEENSSYNAAFPAERLADAVLELRDGRRLQSEVTVARGNYNAPLPDSEILSKLDLYAATALSDAERQSIAQILFDPAASPSPHDLISMMCKSKMI